MDRKQKFRQEIKQSLDRQSLSDDTLGELRSARQAALEHDTRSAIPRWVPVTAISCLVLAVAGLLFYQSSRDLDFPQAQVDDLAVIESEDELELFEDLEFYLWFEQDKNV